MEENVRRIREKRVVKKRAREMGRVIGGLKKKV
jgi:hypothetical protein